jgi:2'-5' RNA ligase
MKRLFIAIDFDPSIIEQIQNISYGVRNAHWIPEDQIHLTLRFIGNCEETKFREILSALYQIQFRTFTIDVKGVGHFPPRGKPNILWVGIKQSAELHSLFNTIQHSLSKIDIPKENRKFHPHITVARIKKKISPSEIIPFLTRNSLFRIDKVPVKNFHLYSSILKQKGAIHNIEETYPLL